MHKFEEAGLGIAPFKLIGVETKTYQACQGAPIQPGGSCDYCATGIMQCCIIRSSDGQTFMVGNECVRHTHDTQLVNETKKAINELKRIARHKSEAAKIDAGMEFLNSPEVQMWLGSQEHPNSYFAAQGKTRADYVQFMLNCSGNKGKLSTIKWIREIFPQELAHA